MTIPYYSNKDKECEFCKGEIYIGYEFVLNQDGLFCDHECLFEHLMRASGTRDAYLTNDRSYKNE